MTDIKSVMWKEWKGVLRQRGSRMKTLLTLLVPFLLFAVWIPYDSGEHWLRDIPSVLGSVVLAVLVVMTTIPDSFAGERERNTLPTLLASRLSDGAILYGKAGFAIVLAWGMALAVIVIGLITVNVAHWSGQLMLYSPRVLAADLSLSAIFAALGVGAGVLISLRSVTVQEAQQTLGAALLLPPTILGPVMLVVARTKPEWGPKALLANADLDLVLLVFGGTLAFAALVLLGLAKARFQRAKLILR